MQDVVRRKGDGLPDPAVQHLQHTVVRKGRGRGQQGLRVEKLQKSGRDAVRRRNGVSLGRVPADQGEAGAR